MKFLSQINVNSEYTLPIVDGTNGQVLTTDGNGAVYWSSSVGATNLNALTDVELTSPSTGQILRYEIPLGGSVPIWRNVTPGYLDPNSSINALGDVTITSAVAGQILQFNGTFWINTTLSTVEYVSKVQHTVKAGVAITKGQAVYVTTSDGTNMIVGLASNTSEATSSKVIGLAASNAAINDQIFVVTEGLIAGLNTSTATAGDPVWLGTGGNLIFGLLNKPVAPAHLVYIGVVTRVQQNNGEIFVNVQNGFELNEIHDALIVSPTAGQLLRRDSDNLWKNWTPNYLTAEADTLATVTARGATTTGNIVVNGEISLPSFIRLTNAGANNAYISESWGINLNGASTHPIQVRSASLSVGYTLGAGTSYGSGNLFVSDKIGVNTTAPTKALDVVGSGIVASFGSAFSTGSFAGIHFGYSETQYGNDNYKKSALVFERTDNHIGQGSNASGKIHFLLNNAGGTSATSLSHSVVTIDSNANGTAGTARVGIGRTSPFYALDVNGQTNSTSFVSTSILILDADLNQGQQPQQGDPANKVASFRWAGTEQGYIDTDAKITFAGFKTPTGTASQFLKANGTVDSNVYITSAALSGYATQAWVNSNFYTQGQIDDFFGGAEPISGYNKSNWDAAYNDKVNSASFNTTNGILTLTQQDGGTVTVDLDGRYLTSDTDAQTLTWDGVSKTLGITNGNDVILSELATEDYVLSQGFVTSVANLAIQTIGGDSSTFNLDTVSGQHGFVRFSTGTWGGTNPYPGNYSHVLSMNQSTVNGNRTVQMYMGDVPGALFWRMNQGGTLHPWERIWTAANDGADSGLNADLLDGNHASAFALASHNHDDRYYTESESDSRFVNVSGDTMNGSLSFDAAAVIKKRITADGFNPVKTATGVLTAMSANSSGNTYYVIETNVPQDEYQMGGFTIEIFGNYYDKNSKTKVDLGGYWNPESNGGFEGFEAHGTNPQYKPTIEVARNNSTGKTAFIIYGVSWGYPIIVARDLWLGYNGTDGGTYGEGWTITGTNDVSSYTNKDTVVWRNAYSDSNPAGYITGYTETDTLASVTARGNATNASIIVQGGQGAAETTDGFGLVIRGNYTNGQYNHRLSKFDRGGGVPLYVQSTSATANVWSNSARFGTYSGNGYEFEVYGAAKTNGDFVSTGQINASGGNSSQWNAAYGWGNHADAPYWNVSLTDAVQVEAQEVIFAGNVTIQGTLTESSSIRFKENIAPLESSLDKVNQLEAVSYNKIGVDNREIGLIAEDVAELFPEVVTYNDEGQPQGIQYQRLSVILLKALQELSQEVNELKKKLN